MYEILNSINIAFLQGIGTTEVLIIFFAILLLFGAKKLPELARGMGKSIKEFKKATHEIEEDIRTSVNTEEFAKNKEENKDYFLYQFHYKNIIYCRNLTRR